MKASALPPLAGLALSKQSSLFSVSNKTSGHNAAILSRVLNSIQPRSWGQFFAE